MVMKYRKQVDRMRERVITDVFPDICQIIPQGGANPIITGPGIVTHDPPTPRLWRGQSNIPCRPDIARAFRPDRFPAQELVIDEYNLELPWDVTIEHSDRVIIQGRAHEVRKIKYAGEWGATTEAIIMEVNASHDNNPLQG